MAEIKIIGLLDVKREQDQRVYEGGGLAPCLRAENHEVKIMEIKNSIDKTRQDKTRQDKTRQSNETNYPCQDMPKRTGNLYGDDRGTGFAGNVWDKNAISPTITTCQGGGREPMILDSFIVAMRGRNPERPNDRTPGLPTEQRLEMAQEGMTNTLTTVQKDNLVLEGVKNEDERKENLLQILRERIEKETFCKWAIRGLFCILQTQILQQNVYAERLFENWKTSTELEQFTHNGTFDKQFVATTDSVRDLWEAWETECSSYRRQFSEQQFIEFKSFMQKLPHEDTQTKIFMFSLWEAGEGIWVLRKALSEIQEIWKPTSDKQGAWSYRIRKLTPREVWRLMGYTDEDFDKAASVVSNTQLYKTAGNAIVKQVLMAIFSQMNIKGVKPWNEVNK